MGYIESTLTENESISFEAEYHWTYKMIAIITSFCVFGIIFLIRWLTTEIALTTKRFVVKTGWIARSTEEIAHRRIEEVKLDQGILGRILGYGKLTVRVQATRKSPPTARAKSPRVAQGDSRCAGGNLASDTKMMAWNNSFL